MMLNIIYIIKNENNYFVYDIPRVKHLLTM